mgnify:FL=1
MKKSEITNGMIFELRTGSTYYGIEGMVYTKTIKHTLVPCETLRDFLETYEDDLTSKYTPKLDIVKIFDNEGKMIWNIDQIDWSKVPIDTKVLVKNSENREWDRRYFAGFINGEVTTFSNGMTSWSTSRPNNPILVSWKYAKLAHNEKTINKEIDNEFKTYCHEKDCLECDYSSSKNNECNCRFNWLVDNYNLSKK